MPAVRPRRSALQHDQFQPKSRADWRRWLARYHATRAGIWLVYLKGDKRQIGYEDAVEEALCFGWIDSLMRPLDSERYMQLFTPRKPRSRWSRLNKTRVKKLAAAGFMTAAGLAAIAAAKKAGTWSSLDAVEALTIPPEFERALAASPAARTNFARFSPSSKKMYLHWINDARRDETRSQRIKESVALIAKGVRGPHLRT